MNRDEEADLDEDMAVPADVRLVRDFVNTYEPELDEESIPTPDRLGDWLTERGVLPAGTRLRPTDVESARTVREGLRQVLMDHAGHESDAAALGALNSELVATPVRVVLAGGGLQLQPAEDTAWNAALAAILDAIRTSAEAGTWPRLKACARDTCRWAFYDASRNQARRWCSMAGCGNHVKMKRAYAARKARATQHDSSPAPAT